MMLEHLGEVAAAERVTKAVFELQTDMAGSSEPWSTSGVGDAVIRRL
jgi:isocitrate/isopropylmalate dehydrogenase